MFFKKTFSKLNVCKLNKAFLSRARGFTLIELLTSISIIAIMTAIIFANPEKPRQQLALQRSTYQVSQAIRLAEGMGISAKEASVCSNTVPKGGYGIYFDISSPSQYTIFADCNGNKVYDAPGEQISVSDLEKNTFIQSISPDTPLSVFFIPPDPQVIIKYGAGSTTSNASIVLSCEINPDITKEIDITDTGLVYVATSTGK
ncbi:MAG: prepilin-type N-terminal cleavage/methylation domain-containing protein [Nitrospiraceae bacterium]|nr:prepilin-type N-terminal cleavage/methylation domain-containing protein [Nitrospiraceae bacterium]